MIIMLGENDWLNYSIKKTFICINHLSAILQVKKKEINDPL